MKRIGQGILSWMILLAFTGCSNSNSKNNEPEQAQNSFSLRQSKADLLGGVVEAVCYSGFRTGQHPDRGDGAVNPSYDQVFEDLKLLSEKSHFKMIRVYDSGENSETVLRVIRENQLNMKMLLGIWLRAELSNHESCAWLNEPIPEEVLQQNKKLNLKEIEKGIRLANTYSDIVIAVNVGNEALVEWNDHKVNVDTIIGYVRKVKQSIGQLVTVADNYKWWAEHGAELAKEVDFVSVHTYPVWEGKDIEDGLSYTIDNLREVRKNIPEVPVVITEAGWPTEASEFADHTGEEKQQQYCSEIMSLAKEMNITTFFFEAFDEDWKGDPGNPSGAEKHWGIFTVDRQPKKAAANLFSEN